MKNYWYGEEYRNANNLRQPKLLSKDVNDIWEFWNNADAVIRGDVNYRKSTGSDFPGNVEVLYRYGKIANDIIRANKTFTELSAIGKSIHPPNVDVRTRPITRSVTAAAVITEITPTETPEANDGNTYDTAEMVRRSSIMAWWVSLFKHNLHLDSQGVIRRNDLRETEEGAKIFRSLKLSTTYYPTAAACNYISKVPSTEVAQALTMPPHECRTKWATLLKSSLSTEKSVLEGIAYTPFLGLAASIPSIKDKLVTMLGSIADQYHCVVLNAFPDNPELQSIMVAMDALNYNTETVPSAILHVQKVLTDVNQKLKQRTKGQNNNDRYERGHRESDQNAPGKYHRGKNRHGNNYDQHSRSINNDYDENSGQNGISPRYQKNNTSRGQKNYHKTRDHPERYREQSPRPKQSGQAYDRGVHSPKRESSQVALIHSPTRNISERAVGLESPGVSILVRSQASKRGRKPKKNVGFHVAKETVEGPQTRAPHRQIW